MNAKIRRKLNHKKMIDLAKRAWAPHITIFGLDAI